MMRPGDRLPSFTRSRINPADMAVWAEALKDPNPIHLDRAAVIAAGLGDRRINQGPANVAYVLNMLGLALPDWQLIELDVRYVGQVREDDTVEAGGTLSALSDGDATCDVWLRLHDGETVLSGTAKLTRA